jgi:predicted signal transduction protein with EAL and GGDEF domain
LIETGNRIRASLRADDTASRFGGDEFVVACRADDIVDVTRIAERLQAAVRTPIELDGKRFSVASSIGISVYPDDGDACADLVQKADAAMYAAKQSGRNAWNFYSAQDHLPALAALELEVELREAIAREQFVVYYQPIINVGSGRVIGAEALVRWAHPERGLLPPSEFIAFAEDHGLIAPIGELVLHAACAQLRRMHLRPSDDFSIAVNVSARQFVKPEFVGTIAAAISVHGIDARRLEIEITESVVMGDSAAVLRTLDRLEALGVRLSLDDFGTGYSSLAYIKSFPIHTLKIDRSFVSDIALNFTDQAIAKTIVTLAHSLGMRTVAEGVETEQQLDLLRSFGADCFQGFLVSRPLASDQFEEFVAGRRSVRVPSA